MNRVESVITSILALGLVTFPLHGYAPAMPRHVVGLGTVHFANSCLPEVQVELDDALALLHSFQYGIAEKEFTRVAKRDPQCAIAYWGAAMTLYHPLWDWPNAEALQKGLRYLDKARFLRKKNERERGYLAAAAAFYQSERNLGRTSRVQAYSEAMRNLHERYPQDSDAAALYALSLLALPSAGVDGLANERKAVVILQRLFSAQPDHPGAAHYLIHATDTPRLARLGLPAARRYAQIAPASPHALHMPSHIFVRLGMWQDSIASNLASLAAADEATRSQRDDGSGDALHAMMYLSYSYLQSGQDERARLVAERISDVQGATASDIVNNQAILEALHAVETHQWTRAAALPLRPSAFPYARIRTFWARAIGAARSGDVASARQNIEKLDEARASMLAYIQSVDTQMHMGHSGSSDFCVQQLEAQAWLAWAEGKPAEALEIMRAATRKEESYSVESRTVPAYEMLGDLFLELHEPRLALDAYETALKIAPARFNALSGAAHASQAMGDSGKARLYYATLMRCCSPAATRKELEEAKLFIVGE